MKILSLKSDFNATELGIIGNYTDKLFEQFCLNKFIYFLIIELLIFRCEVSKGHFKSLEQCQKICQSNYELKFLIFVKF